MSVRATSARAGQHRSVLPYSSSFDMGGDAIHTTKEQRPFHHGTDDISVRCGAISMGQNDNESSTSAQNIGMRRRCVQNGIYHGVAKRVKEHVYPGTTRRFREFACKLVPHCLLSQPGCLHVHESC